MSFKKILSLGTGVPLLFHAHFSQSIYTIYVYQRRKKTLKHAGQGSSRTKIEKQFLSYFRPAESVKCLSNSLINLELYFVLQVYHVSFEISFKPTDLASPSLPQSLFCCIH